MSTASAQTLVRIAGDAIVASFQNAKNPAVWRARLDQLDDAIFKIEAEKGKYVLNLSKSGAGNEEIAVFATKSAAEQALAAVTEVLFSLESRAPEVLSPQPAAADAEAACEAGIARTSCKHRRCYWIAFTVLFLVIFSVIYVGMSEVSQSIGSNTAGLRTIMPDAPTAQTMGGDVKDLPEIDEGRPLSAEDYFGE